ncbi:MAG: hypothetical protein II784_04850 [Oscillospiraceae bacterium]|nr:hypothetical protein [Oscillospiraceae bacterium]
MKRAIAIILLIAALFSLAACASKRKTWYEGMYRKQLGTNTIIEGEFSLELKKNGTGIHKHDGESYDVTWKKNGNNYTIKEDCDGVSVKYTGEEDDTGLLRLYDGNPSDPSTCVYVYVFSQDYDYGD